MRFENNGCFFTNTGKAALGEALGLWDIARFKIIGMTIMEIFIAQAKDEDLKNQLNTGLETLIVPHIEKILHGQGLEVPTIPQRKNLDIISKKIEPNTYIEDDEIANAVREIYRYGLLLVARALTYSTREDVRHMIWNIFNDDYNGFEVMMKLHREKNWLLPPPTRGSGLANLHKLCKFARPDPGMRCSK